jgi:hypothetical protein
MLRQSPPAFFTVKKTTPETKTDRGYLAGHCRQAFCYYRVMNSALFSAPNMQALAATCRPAAQWLSHMSPDISPLLAAMGKNSHGMTDLQLPDGRYLFDAAPPAVCYGKWIPDSAHRKDSGPAADRHNLARSATVVIGCNVGYGLVHLVDNTPDTHKILLLEPDAAMLALCLSQSDFSPFIRSGKLTVLPPDRTVVHDIIRRLDVQYLFGSIHLRADLPSQQISPLYAEWANIVHGMMDSFGLEMLTLRKVQDTMVSNELANFRTALRNGSLNPLENMLRGLPALIVGAGPSLESNGPVIAPHTADAVIATSLQALPACRKAGIKPHFCLAIDWGEVMTAVYNRLDNEWAADIPLIYSTKTRHEVVARYPGPALPLWTVGGLATFIGGSGDLVLEAGSNVNVAIVRLLYWAGVRRFTLLGQDLGWKGDRSHASGHHATMLRSHQAARDIDGNPIRTDNKFLAAARELEQDFRIHTDIEAYNIYGGGLPIHGAANITAQDALDNNLLQARGASLDKLRLALQQAMIPCNQPAWEPREEQWRSSLRHVQRRLEKLLRKAARNHDDITATLRQVHAFLRQDPLYLPYLYNEIMDIAGMGLGRLRYGPADLKAFKDIVRRVLHKVRHMDSVLCTPAHDSCVPVSAASSASGGSVRPQAQTL